MSVLKLAKLPDRTPVKLAISISPDLNRALQNYAQLYQKTYGQEESIVELVPFMLDSFLQADRMFAKAQKQAGRVFGGASKGPALRSEAK